MKKIGFIMFVVLVFLGTTLSAQKGEKYGKTLNLGLGIGGYSGYYGYLARTLPVFHINYEFDAARNFTLAPFITVFSYRGDYYRETVIPLGIKGSYYFDQVFEAGPAWDFYLAGSLGFAIRNASWDEDYHGDRDYYHRASPLFLDIHVGTEYHFNRKVEMFLDLSSGVSTIGLAIR
ncbi:MAG: hypothetical protein IPH45_00605 [Bacteroidales bacterium]|nr:hypothetical protein [Bacteroidales bacterium]